MNYLKTSWVRLLCSAALLFLVWTGNTIALYVCITLSLIAFEIQAYIDRQILETLQIMKELLP